MMMKQIILITDGCSNVGIEPAAAAAHANMEGIVVNVIGIVDRDEIGERGVREIKEIAEAGGGMDRIIPMHQLSQTVQMMTRQTVVHTLQQIVDKQLRHIMSEGSSVSVEHANHISEEVGVERLAPGKRQQVVQVIDQLAESTPLRVALLVDASASMRPKLAFVEDAIRDLLLSLQARTGHSEICVFHYPGSGIGAEAVMDVGWTRELDKMQQLFYKLNMKGATPTGPALMKVVRYYAGETRDHGADEAGMLGEYIV